MSAGDGSFHGLVVNNMVSNPIFKSLQSLILSAELSKPCTTVALACFLIRRQAEHSKPYRSAGSALSSESNRADQAMQIYCVA